MRPLIIFIFFSSVTHGQTRRIYGQIVDTSFSKEFYAPTILISDTGTKSTRTNLGSADKKGKFNFELPKTTSNPYKLSIVTIGRQTKEVCIYDTTKLPLKIILENTFNEESVMDNRKYDPTVKLVKYKNSELKFKNDNIFGDEKIFSRNCSEKTHELTIKYNDACGLRFKPIVKFSSDTLFIKSNDDAVDIHTWSFCTYSQTIWVAGLKTKKYIVLLDGQTLTEKQ